MAQDEFSLIDRYFSDIGPSSAETRLGIGDDAAVIEVTPGQQLVVSMDTLIAGVHFLEDTRPADIAYKSLAVNLSDLAAMAATPSWFLLSLTLPENDADWLTQFADELKQTADTYGLQLLGGDTCRGALSISIQIAGQVARDCFVTRQGARPGDIILVSGELGNAALGLAGLRGEQSLSAALQAKCELALKRPRPRLELSSFLQAYASAAIDLSDGLMGDLGHILVASDCGAWIDREALPVDEWIAQQNAYHYALEAGDDYEICCCVAPRHQPQIEAWNRDHPQCLLTAIGEVTDSGYLLRTANQQIDLRQSTGFRHFG